MRSRQRRESYPTYREGTMSSNDLDERKFQLLQKVESERLDIEKKRLELEEERQLRDRGFLGWRRQNSVTLLSVAVMLASVLITRAQIEQAKIKADAEIKRDQAKVVTDNARLLLSDNLQERELGKQILLLALPLDKVADIYAKLDMVSPFIFFENPHNYPNPFNPRETSTKIVLGLSKPAYVTAKIYDFAGEFVRTLRQNVLVAPNQPIPWDGKTEDGTEVANGTYLCHIKARDTETSKTVTAVMKITVLKKDK